MPKNPQIIIPADLHTDVKIEVARRNEILSPNAKRFRMEDAAVEAFRPWLQQSRSHRRSENQKTEKLATA
jgi:hypothetical protein